LVVAGWSVGVVVVDVVVVVQVTVDMSKFEVGREPSLYPRGIRINIHSPRRLSPSSIGFSRICIETTSQGSKGHRVDCALTLLRGHTWISLLSRLSTLLSCFRRILAFVCLGWLWSQNGGDVKAHPRWGDKECAGIGQRRRLVLNNVYASPEGTDQCIRNLDFYSVPVSQNLRWPCINGQ
jgi:hypothetical protein